MKKEIVSELFGKFENAKISCKSSENVIPDHFVDLNKMIGFIIICSAQLYSADFLTIK